MIYIFIMNVLALSASLLQQSVSCQSLQDGVQNSTMPVEKQVLYLLTILPYYNPDPSLNPSWNEGDNIQPALELAKDQINNSSALLQNYTLELVHTQGGCDRSSLATLSSVAELFGVHLKRDNLVGIIGPGCSASTLELAPLTSRSEIAIVMLHGSGSPILANRTRFPYSLGTLGSTDNYARGFIYLVETAQWRRVALLYDISNTELQHLLPVALNSSFIFSSPVTTTFIPLEDVRQQFIRVIFVTCTLELSRRILCLSYHSGMIFGNFQWVFMDQTFDDMVKVIYFTYDGSSYNCSQDDMATALEMTSLLLFNLQPDEDSSTISTTSYDEYLDQYRIYRERYNTAAMRARNSTYSVWATYLYDSVWAWALVLDNLTRSRADNNFEVSYGTPDQSDRIVEQFYRTSFSGMSGEIDFQRETGFSSRKVDIVQIRNGSVVEVAVIGTDTISKKGDFHFIGDSFLISDMMIGAILAAIIGLQLISTIVLQVLTVVHRKEESIRAASYKLLHISYIGCYLVGIGMFLTAINDAVAAFINFCQLLWSWCIPIGFTLAFGAVGIRTWKIYRIFNAYRTPDPFISKPVLVAVLLLILVPVTVTAIVWTVVDPLRNSRELFVSEDSMLSFRLVCKGHNVIAWTGTSFGCAFSVLIVTAIFSFLTSNITNPSFTTKAMRVLSYLECILFFIGISAYYVVLESSSLEYYDFVILFHIIIILMLQVFYICIFIPPLLPIFKRHWQKFLRGK